MGIKVRRDGATVTISAFKVKLAGVLRTIRTAKAMQGGTLRTVATFAPPMTASASPTSVSGSETFHSPRTVASNPTTVTPVGGSAPYTYLWTVTDTTLGSPSFSNATGATTVVYQSLSPDTDNSGTVRCTVTDSFGTTATADVTFSLALFFG